MIVARNLIAPTDERGVYHCMVRCVRRAFLCGDDPYTGENHDHRKQWIQDRLVRLNKAFSVDLLTYALLSNHGHYILSTRPDLAAELTAEEVARRWLSFYTPKHLNDAGEKVYEVCKEDVRSITSDEERVELLRARLSSLSWFMKALNEPIARRANKEDGVSGRFWGGRFKSQRLVDEPGILACMCYVDLNRVRAKLADSLEDSVFTGVYDRIMGEKAQQRQQELEAQKEAFSPEKYDEELQKLIALKKRSALLVDLDGEETPFARINKQEYLQIVDFTGRQFHKGKPDQIGDDIRPLLESLELGADEWISTIRNYRNRFFLIAGTVEHIRQAAAKLKKRWLRGCGTASAAFKSSDPPESVPT